MKRLKRIMALVIAMAMVLSMGAMTAFADGEASNTANTYTITIKNTKSETNASINGHTFSAYKLFDLTYVDDKNNSSDTTVYAQDQGPHAYYLSTTSKFYTTAAAKTEIEKYFTLTALPGDSSKVQATPKLKDTNGKNPWEDGYDADHLGTDSCFTATEAYALAQALKPYFPTTADATSPAAANEQAVIDVSSKGAGYYLVTGDGQGLDENGTAAETVTAAIALTSTDPKAEIIAKLSATDVEKEIDENGGVKYDEHAIGETVPYKVTSSVPNMTGYEKYFFVFSDTLSKGLTLNDNATITDDAPYDEGFKVTLTNGTDSLVLTRVADAAAAASNSTKTTYYVKKSGQNFEIVFHDFIQYRGTLITEDNYATVAGGNAVDRNKIGTYYGAYEGWDIVIQYSATINEDAAIGNTGNVNTGKLIFSNNPDETANGTPGEPDYPNSDDTDVIGETPESKTITYVTGVKFNKVDKDGNPLADAEFTFTGTALKNLVEDEKEIFRQATEDELTSATYYLLKDGTYTTTAPTPDTADTSNNTYTLGTWRQYVQTEWTSDPAAGTSSYTFGGETVDLYTSSATPWKPAYVKDTVKSWSEAIMVADPAGTFYLNKNGQYATDVPEADRVDNTLYKAVTKTWEEMTQAEKAAASVSYTAKTDSEGILTFTGLRVGTYKLTEIAAPDGYNMLSEPVQISVEWTAPSKNANTLVADDDACTWTVKYKFKDADEWTTIATTDVANLFPLNIVNQSGVELPSTGGIGTTIFYVVGAILVIGAGVVLITKRRMDA